MMQLNFKLVLVPFYYGGHMKVVIFGGHFVTF